LGHSNAASKINSAVNAGVDIFNHSWGSTMSTTVGKAVAYAYKMNRVSVGAMGNHSGNVVQYPAAFRGVIAVGATQDDDTHAGYSNWGNHITVTAPGGTNIIWANRNQRDIWSSWNTTDSYEYDAGTSMATPIVSGIASLLKGYAQNVLQRNLYNDDIAYIIKLSTDKVGQYSYDSNGWNSRMGYGRVNAHKALQTLQSLQDTHVLKHWEKTGGTIESNSSFSGVFYGLPGAPDGHYTGTRYEVWTTLPFPENFSTIDGVWGRGVASIGYSPDLYNFTTGYTDVVRHTLGSITLKTYIYYVCRTGGGYCGWYPTTASNVKFAYTVLGILDTSPQPPSPPTITLDASGINPKLNWNAVCGADSYKIYRGTIQGQPGTVGCHMIGVYDHIGTTTSTTFTDNMVWIDPNSNILACYYVTSVNQYGESSPSNEVGVHGMAPLKEDELITAQTIALPMKYAIHDNYPNPFNPSTTIRYELPEASRVSLVVYDIMGREVQRLVDGVIEPGYYTATWEGRNKSGSPVASGIYIYRFTALPLSDAGMREGMHYVKTMLFTK
jgi:hypothetical protein